jgi:hypothetical protein
VCRIQVFPGQVHLPICRFAPYQVGDALNLQPELPLNLLNDHLFYGFQPKQFMVVPEFSAYSIIGNLA